MQRKLIRADTIYRSVTDEGRCLQTFDDACVGKLETQAAEYANGLVSNPTPNPGSNLTQGSLSHVCYDIGNLLQENFPKECDKYLNTTGSASLYGTGKCAVSSGPSGPPVIITDMGACCSRDIPQRVFHLQRLHTT